MKLLLKILCLITLIYCFYFPLTYFHSDADKKEIKISHILLDSKDKLLEIREDIINKNILFGDAAEKYSQCESKDRKGDIGYNVQNGTLNKDFEKVAFNLPLREISQPVQTEYGWHLIKITDVKYFSDRDSFGVKY